MSPHNRHNKTYTDSDFGSFPRSQHPSPPPSYHSTDPNAHLVPQAQQSRYTRQNLPRYVSHPIPIQTQPTRYDVAGRVLPPTQRTINPPDPTTPTQTSSRHHASGAYPGRESGYGNPSTSVPVRGHYASGYTPRTISPDEDRVFAMEGDPEPRRMSGREGEGRGRDRPDAANRARGYGEVWRQDGERSARDDETQTRRREERIRRQEEEEGRWASW
ncbi:hypothetical protein P280DRAFT_464846 [Massarina eburnea CBS 473.64]|uniref:Uncharacterized protein n=1 Tax=Massarina eburnea CBS 473.64 TaxID=1395130 RepID=A0A6A6SFQ0_9PLEO|nr:hypothetical protein P280DRAFT_464846 [Massarina eburnea CBS 473.64]